MNFKNFKHQSFHVATLDTWKSDARYNFLSRSLTTFDSHTTAPSTRYCFIYIRYAYYKSILIDAEK